MSARAARARAVLVSRRETALREEAHRLSCCMQLGEMREETRDSRERASGARRRLCGPGAVVERARASGVSDHEFGRAVARTHCDCAPTAAHCNEM